MNHSDSISSWDHLADLIAQQDGPSIEAYLQSLSSAETARAVSRLDEDSRGELLTLLTPEEAADMLRDLPEEQAAEMMEDLPAAAAAAIVDELPADEQADLLADMDEEDAEAILDAMPGEDARQARTLLQYPENTAGGLMTTEFLSFTDDMTIGEVLNDLDRNSATYADYEVQYCFITASDRRLLGVLKLRDLVLSPRGQNVTVTMVGNPVTTPPETPLQRLAQMFEDHSFMGIPVVDNGGKLMGIVERSAVLEAWANKDKNTFLLISGIVGGEEFRSMPLPLRAFRRLSWLMPNIALNIIAASVIAAYQETLQAVIALAVFLPIISDMSGCSGNQAVAVSIRELALGLIKPGEFTRIFVKETALGAMNGILLGLLLGFVAFLWKGNIVLGLVVGSALAVNTLVSVLLGGSVPLLLRRLRLDPALASGPILTTVTDMCGFFLVLSLASSVLDRL